MIEIEEEYKLLEWVKHLQDENASGAWIKDDDVKFKQILQDHEDAKKFNDINYMSESHKECANNCANLAERGGKDRQIVKRLEERKKKLHIEINLEINKFGFSKNPKEDELKELQKILAGKED